jgi:hypothetical protein
MRQRVGEARLQGASLPRPEGRFRGETSRGLRSLYRLPLACGIMIPHRCLPNADNISGRSRDGQRLEVARSGAITADATSVLVSFGQGDDALRREVRVVNRKFPNGGSWSLFLCPTCGRRVRKLKLHEKVMCWRCCAQSGLGYRISDGTAAERAEARARRTERLQAQLGSGPLRLRPRPWTSDGSSRVFWS